jgi:hypothetical protein
MTSHQSLQEPSDPGPPPKTDQIAQEIGKLIHLVNDSYRPISRPSTGAHTGNLASHLTWNDDGELAID